MNMNVRTVRFAIGGMAWLVLLSLVLAACSQTTVVPTEPPTKPATAAPTEPPTAAPTEPPATEPPTPEGPQPSGISPDPQRVEFQAEDGAKLVGYYYPSKYANAPVMILMHWAVGDLCDWSAIAPWLQNRADEDPAALERCADPGASLPSDMATPWWDSTWFPPMAPEASIAVFAFDFRGYGESETGGGRTDLAKDARAAFKAAAGLEGVDANRMAALGASIGADGAPDGCLLHNQETGGGCVGALSLSPGGYLGMEYSTVVNDLDPTPVWCLAGELDPSTKTCEGASGESYRSVIYSGTREHGMTLLMPEFDPQPLVLIQEFIELVFGESVKVE